MLYEIRAWCNGTEEMEWLLCMALSLYTLVKAEVYRVRLLNHGLAEEHRLGWLLA